MLFCLLSNKSLKRSRGKLSRYDSSVQSFSDSLSILISVAVPHAYPIESDKKKQLLSGVELENVNLPRQAKTIAYT